MTHSPDDIPRKCADTFGAIRADLATLKARQTDISAKVNELHKAIVGNGRDGLTMRVGCLERVEANRRWTLRAVILCLAAVVGKLLHGLVSEWFNGT